MARGDAESIAPSTSIPPADFFSKWEEDGCSDTVEPPEPHGSFTRPSKRRARKPHVNLSSAYKNSSSGCGCHDDECCLTLNNSDATELPDIGCSGRSAQHSEERSEEASHEVVNGPWRSEHVIIHWTKLRQSKLDKENENNTYTVSIDDYDGVESHLQEGFMPPSGWDTFSEMPPSQLKAFRRHLIDIEIEE